MLGVRVPPPFPAAPAISTIYNFYILKDHYVNLRPVRLFEGVPCPLANKKPGDIDFYVVRENVEGEYSAIGGIKY